MHEKQQITIDSDSIFNRPGVNAIIFLGKLV